MSFTNPTIEAASVSFILTISDLFGPPITIKGFAPEDMFDFDMIKPTEVIIGVDAIASFGMVNVLIPQKVHLSPDSPSIALFDAWYAAQVATRSAYAASAVISYPGLGKQLICSGGGLTGHTIAPTAKKILQPQEYEITWNTVVVVPLV